MLTIALSKGRILDDTLPLLAAAGIVPSENPDKSRKLIIPTSLPDVRLLIVRATDVPTYVEHGAADLGVAGKDVLMEYGGQGLYEPLDLRIANCKLMTAGAIGAPEPKGRLRVATKFVNVAKRYYAEQGRQVDVIKLYGSMELAPLVGLADKIIDVVDTGNTLRANGLEVKTSQNYESLFRMLDAGRFEVFPREVVVIDGELEDASRAGLHLAIDQHVALHYPAAFYFFVSRQRPELAEAIRQGLEKAIADGSFERLFERHFKTRLGKLALRQRRIIELKNPYLPGKTPFQREALWYRP